MNTEINPLRELAGQCARKHLKTEAHVAHYLDVYWRFFAPLRDKPIRLLEIGVAEGGSIELWERFFPRAQIFALDLMPTARAFATDRTRVFVGDQGDPGFLDWMVAESGGAFDIVIDDGGHRMNQQQTALARLFRATVPGGLYAIEDLHTSYWSAFGGAYRSPHTTIEALKSMIDCLHAVHATRDDAWTPAEYAQARQTLAGAKRPDVVDEPFPGVTRLLAEMHLYDSLAILVRAGGAR